MPMGFLGCLSPECMMTVPHRLAQPQGFRLHLHGHELAHRRRQRRALHPEALHATDSISVSHSIVISADEHERQVITPIVPHTASKEATKGLRSQ